MRIGIVGLPNAGKSSLFNALLGEDRAIVAAEPGTTRDRVSERLVVAGVRVTLSDTAGVREATSAIEAMGVERTLATLEGAAVALWVVDGSRPWDPAGDPLVPELAGRRVLAALAKSDLGAVVPESAIRSALPGSELHVARVSAVTGGGLDTLTRSLASLLGADRAGGLAGAVANPRHADALARARAALARAGEAGASGAPGEIVALELRESLGALGEVSGRSASEELLDRIFARFCVGK